ncbi:MAG: DUF6629 family protein, partial [Candidatus Babeliales bacterium]
MCFSASASFTAGSLLALIGGFSLYQVKNNRYYLVAAIPFLFAIQQFFEGFLWLSFTNKWLASYQNFFVYGFLFFAFVLWPIWIPVTIQYIEPNKKQKKYISTNVVSGLTIGLLTLFSLIFLGADASIKNNHILYEVPISPYFSIPGSLLYIYATIVPFFLSSIDWTRLFGA